MAVRMQKLLSHDPLGWTNHDDSDSRACRITGFRYYKTSAWMTIVT